ncbi:gametocyte-specific factor 1 homolog, partial [Pollicipes pollicipes]|uniref:gametocyte-specific factor 1 homolog n=1 Tax=Pollicipes pollicipes TaxID=41117 RepID=UPI00188544FE
MFHIPKEMFTCPINKSHRVSGLKYELHTIRCAKQMAGRDVKFCPFNGKHIVDVAKFWHHLEHCPDKDRVDRYVRHALEEMRAVRRAEPVETAPGLRFSGPDESWDDCGDTPRRGSYDPQLATANRDIFRFPQGPMSKSERRQFRSEAVARLRAIQRDKTAAAEAGA